MDRREAIKRTALVLGIALSPSTLAAALAREEQPTANAPRYLTPEQFATAAAVAERILPCTETPGAGDVGVPAFLDLCVGKYLTAGERVVFLEGLSALDATSRRNHSRAFAALAAGEQEEQLQALAAATSAAGTRGTFLHHIRELTLIGYFTSPQIGRDVLRYDPVPGRWDADIPLGETGGVAWSE
jgi:gluconate 2-dehydrogenase gamma chain